MRINPILRTDSYKFSHDRQYPPGTTHVFSYIEARSTEIPEVKEIVFFGLQGFIKEYLGGSQVTAKDVDQAKAFVAAHGLPFNEKGWRRIVEVHGGKFPVRIRAVEEGTRVPLSNVMLTIENTDPELPWITSFVETALLRGIWYPSSVATISNYAKRTILKHLRATSDMPESEIQGAAMFMLHDFGARGVSSSESAQIGGAAHLVNFMGSDTVEGICYAAEMYGEPMAGFSVPAAEHSTITSWGKDREADAYENMINEFGGLGKIYAVVSDSYNIYTACEKLWGGSLKEKVLSRGGRLVVRPDSGYPPEVVVNVLEILGEKFGFTVNSKGYRVLHQSVRVIQGDGIDLKMIDTILCKMADHGWSAENVAFGMGGGLLQKVNRDTFSWAMKASAAKIGGIWQNVFKDPETMHAKVSKRGRLSLKREAERLKTYSIDDCILDDEDVLEVVFENGELLVERKFSDIRVIANDWL